MPASLTTPASRRWAGAGTLSLCSLLSISCCRSSFDPHASRCLYFGFLLLCCECQKGMKLISSFLPKWRVQPLFSRKSVQPRAEKKTTTTQTWFTRLSTHTHTHPCLLIQTGRGFCPLTHACAASTYNHLSDSRRAAFLFCSILSLAHFISSATSRLSWQRCCLARHQMERPAITGLCFH